PVEVTESERMGRSCLDPGGPRTLLDELDTIDRKDGVLTSRDDRQRPRGNRRHERIEVEIGEKPRYVQRQVVRDVPLDQNAHQAEPAGNDSRAKPIIEHHPEDRLLPAEG